MRDINDLEVAIAVTAASDARQHVSGFRRESNCSGFHLPNAVARRRLAVRSSRSPRPNGTIRFDPLRFVPAAHIVDYPQFRSSRRTRMRFRRLINAAIPIESSRRCVYFPYVMRRSFIIDGSLVGSDANSALSSR